MAKVYIVQRPVVRVQGRLVDKFDVGPAAIYGDLITLLTSRCQPFTPEPVVLELRAKLDTFCDEDWLLCLGSPVLIGWATAIAAGRNAGRVGMLQWHGVEQEYRAIRADLGCAMPKGAALLRKKGSTDDTANTDRPTLCLETGRRDSGGLRRGQQAGDRRQRDQGSDGTD